MKKFSKASIIAAAVLVLLALVAGCGTAAERQFMTFAAPPASSSLYPYWVAVGKAVQQEFPEYQITIQESQGAADIISKVRNGSAILGNSMSNSDHELYHGIGVYEGKADTNTRMLWYWDVTPIQYAVAKEENIKSVSELEGKRFNPSATGGGTNHAVMNVFRLFNIKPDLYEATQQDAIDAYSDRQIMGTVKLGTGGDSVILQLQAARPVDVMSFTDDELAQIQKAFPYLTPVVIPAGAYDFIDTDIKTYKVMSGALTTANLPQEDGYKMFKAVNEGGRPIWEAAYPPAALFNMIEITLQATTMLHAGTVQYLTEMGHEVPAHLIPPEYVPVKK